MKTQLKTIFLFILIAINVNTWGQKKAIPPLEREITLHADNLSIDVILSGISEQAGFVFSYSPDAINASAKATLHSNKKTVRYALNEIFGDNITYKSKGKYVILKKNTIKPETENKIQRIEGYVYDSKTGEKLTEASIYDKTLLASAVTDQYGYFSMEIPANKPITSLQVSKIGYTDTIITPTQLNHKIKSIEIASSVKDTARNKNLFSYVNLPKLTPKWLIPKKTKINSINISDSILSKVQISLIPMLSTNNLMAGNTVNKLSFNATVGYVQGVEYAEFGGIMNIDLNNVSYAQFAGVGNIVGGSVTGYQSAGVFNFANSVKGVQNAGTINISASNSDYQIAGVGNFATSNIIQAAGVINISKQSKIQLAGVVNFTDDANIQVAGVVNFAPKVRDVQISGVVNLAGDEVGEAQIAGVLNMASKVSQAQVAGCVNYAKISAGTQISSLVNITGYARQGQIGLLNIADSCGGVPIGLLSFIKKGYHKLEVSGDEFSSVNIAFRTGVKRFHTAISTGYTLNNYPLWNYGYGLGTSFGRTDKCYFDIDITTKMLLDGKSFAYAGNLHNIYLGIDRRIAHKLSIAAGVTYNLLFTNTLNSRYKTEYASLAPYSMSNSSFNNGTNIKTWIGGKVALRLF